MKFTTILLGNKKKQVRLQSEEIYDPFHVFPNLQNVIKNNVSTLMREMCFMILLVIKDH